MTLSGISMQANIIFAYVAMLLCDSSYRPDRVLGIELMFLIMSCNSNFNPKRQEFIQQRLRIMWPRWKTEVQGCSETRPGTVPMAEEPHLALELLPLPTNFWSHPCKRKKLARTKDLGSQARALEWPQWTRASGPLGGRHWSAGV